MTKLSLYLASLILSSNFSASTTPTPASVGRGPQVSVVAQSRVELVERQLVQLTNTQRRSQGLSRLTVNPLLVQVAREHCREMWEKNYFDHYSPTPELRTPMVRYVHDLGRTPRWARLGENLFYCSIVDAELGHRSLMESTKHRENILDPSFEQIGVGVFISPDGQFWVTELFLTQED